MAWNGPEAAAGRRIQSVDRAVELLQAIGAAGAPRTIGELAADCGLNRSTAWRLLMTLEHHGLIDRDPLTQRYVVGYELLRLAASRASHEALASRARPVIDRLAQQTGETVSFVVTTPRGILSIEQSAAATLATVNIIGVRLPIHATASGKLRLAYAGGDERRELLAGEPERYTAHTTVDVHRVLTEADEARRAGFAIERDEFEPGVSGVAAPVFDVRGHAAAFVSIWGLSARLPDERLRTLARDVRAAAAVITGRLAAREQPAM